MRRRGGPRAKSAVWRTAFWRAAFWRENSGVGAVDFALVATPFIFLLLFLVQLGLYFTYKMVLDTAVLQEAEALNNTFSSNTAPSIPTGAQLAAQLTSFGGGLVTNTTALSAEIQPLSSLASAVTPISTSDLVNPGTAQTVLAVRASYSVPTLVPGFNNQLVVYSSALVRRQNQ